MHTTKNTMHKAFAHLSAADALRRAIGGLLLSAAVALALLLSACAGVNRLGEVGRYEVHEVYKINAFAPSVAALVAVDEAGNIVPLGSGGSAGFVFQAAQVGALVYLGAEVGNLRIPDQVTLKQ